MKAQERHERHISPAAARRDAIIRGMRSGKNADEIAAELGLQLFRRPACFQDFRSKIKQLGRF